ncbi:tetratricopeptide repeat protein [Sporosarcina siberiensis]|uniref:Tetratricopeptide repeat protein n=1 Tax=Sporosarcina siberiensis TaxID=1365606 RepID=A0ABW4SH62_9BACL
MSLNQKALLLFESNQYNEALASFERAVSKERTVQALNNLAWMYLYEEEEAQRAKVLLEEVLVHDPQSHFPYNMLGEIAMQEKNWLEAKEILEKSIKIVQSTEAIHNLAVIHYKMGDFQKAVNFFSEIAEDSNLIRWFEVLARIRNQDVITAKSILDSWNEHADDYTGAIEPADAYVEIDCFKEAKIMFEKEWEEYFVSPYIINRYAYALFQLNEFRKCEKLIQESIDKKIIEIVEEKQEPYDGQWTEADKSDRIAELQFELTGLRQLTTKLEAGYRPPLEIELHATSSCYLFGCVQHGNAEYL